MAKEYPEHDKLRAVKNQSQCQGEFIQWLWSQGLVICEFRPDRLRDDCYYPTSKSMHQLLADYHEIDLDKLNAEKEAMYQELHAAANK